MKYRLICFFLILSSCNSSDQEKGELVLPMQEIKGRDDSGSSFPVYRVRAPESWIRRDPLPNETLIDTKKPLVEFIINDPEGVVRIWIHNFPTNEIQERVPPIAQKERWQRQFELLHPHETEVAPQAFNGYSGLLFIGTGTLQGAELNQSEQTVMAWALQIAERHYRNMAHSDDDQKDTLFKQMRADVTLKAQGPARAVEKHQEEIQAFAHSFELIEEIPDPW